MTQTEANLPARRPQCPSGHGPMTLRPLDRQTFEQLWTGVWYDCAHVEYGHACRNSHTNMSIGAKEYAEAAKRGRRD
jgi:hypothetical protein